MLYRKAVFFLLFFLSLPAAAEETLSRAVILEQLEQETAAIDNASWRDQTYRELAKTLASDGNIDRALAVLEKIENPDTKALTVRGIGMAAADNGLSPAEYTAIFTRLRGAADKITHPPSYAIALTYIAMAQAFAGDNEGAWKTASEMENDALRHKAYGETAEIQAEKGNFMAAMKSLALIDSAAFRNKATRIVAKILADQGYLQDSYKAAGTITNPYHKAQALQYVLDIQKPRDTTGKKN